MLTVGLYYFISRVKRSTMLRKQHATATYSQTILNFLQHLSPLLDTLTNDIWVVRIFIERTPLQLLYIELNNPLCCQAHRFWLKRRDRCNVRRLWIAEYDKEPECELHLDNLIGFYSVSHFLQEMTFQRLNGMTFWLSKNARIPSSSTVCWNSA